MKLGKVRKVAFSPNGRDRMMTDCVNPVEFHQRLAGRLDQFWAEQNAFSSKTKHVIYLQGNLIVSFTNTYVTIGHNRKLLSR